MCQKICERCKYRHELYCKKRPLIPLEDAIKICKEKREAEQDLREKIIVNFGKDD